MSDLTAAAHRLSGSLLGRYQLIAQIASGGMGTVYLARVVGDHRFQRLFALKVLHDHLSDNPEFVAMLHDEAQLAARVHHPYVNSIVDSGHEDGAHFVAMEYVNGCSLRQLLRRNLERRPPALIIQLVAQLLEGLHAVHSVTDEFGALLNLVHRDVSPENVLVGADGVARLADFGIAKAEVRMTQTVPGVHKGKVAYMAPEQVRGLPIDRRADLFSAGILLYNALTATRLFDGPSSGAILENIVQGPIRPPSEAGLRPPRWLDTICLKALARDPGERFASAIEMADVLREAAVAHHMTASSREIAAWVAGSFSQELEARREAIRHLIHDRRGTMPIVPLSVVPRVGTPDGLSGGPDSGPIAVADEQLLSPTVTPPPPSAWRSRRWWIAAGFVTGIVLALLGLGLFRQRPFGSRLEPVVTVLTANAPPPQPMLGAPPPPPPPAPKAAPPAPPRVEERAVLDDARPAREPRRRERRHRRDDRAPPATPVAGRSSFEAPEVEALERNPYRRSD